MWLPFDNSGIEQRETILQLTGGSQGFPSHRLVFTENPPLPSGKKACCFCSNYLLLLIFVYIQKYFDLYELI